MENNDQLDLLTWLNMCTSPGDTLSPVSQDGVVYLVNDRNGEFFKVG